VIRSDQSKGIEGRAGRDGKDAGQFALGEFAFIYVELNCRSGLRNIPRSRHDPKILGGDDAEVVGD
jgi:hypothetical protein